MKKIFSKKIFPVFIAGVFLVLLASVGHSAFAKSNLSQEALARLVGTKRSNISRMESGAQNISLDSFLKIASALGKEVHLTLAEPAPEQTVRYSLRLYDEELLTFSMEDGGLSGLRTSLLSVRKDPLQPLPDPL